MTARRDVTGMTWRDIWGLLMSVLALVSVVMFAMAYVRGWEIEKLVFWGIVWLGFAIQEATS